MRPPTTESTSPSVLVRPATSQNTAKPTTNPSSAAPNTQRPMAGSDFLAIW